MKKNSILTLITALLFTITSCSEDKIYNITIDKHAIAIPADGGEETVKVETNGTWTVVVEEDAKKWIKVSFEESSDLSADLDITIDTPNSGTEKRVGVVYIKNGDNTRDITVTQEFSTGLVVDINDVYGKWKLTECPEALMMIGSEFTFNDDKTCIAKLAMMGNREVAGTYELEGNIVNILSEGKIITIAISEMTETNDNSVMNALVMGKYESVLTKGGF